ncbi:MAG: hypothetical protein ACTS6J_08360 [Burkholderiales bacterium]
MHANSEPILRFLPFAAELHTTVPEMKRSSRTFRAREFQLASAMVRLVEQSRRIEMEPLEQYVCYWVSFKNIYVTIANEQGYGPNLLTSDGRAQLVQVGGLSMPKVRTPKEREQLRVAYAVFSPQLKERLILHRCTRFFVNRLPRFQGQELTIDFRRRRLNGVLSVGQTVDAANPVWSPIDQALYYAYLKGDRTGAGTDKLGREILSLLYTVANNLFHGGKRADDASDTNVVEHALPLLKEIVHSFVSAPERRAYATSQPAR